MLRSRTRSKELSRVLPASDLNFRIARLVVLFEDLRIELNAIAARSLGKLDYTDVGYRRLYFLRRAIATLLEFKGALLRINELPEFRVVKDSFTKEEKEQWDEALAFFKNETNPLKLARDDVGGHFQERAAEYALNHPGSTNAIMSIVIGKSDGAGPKLNFAGEIVARSLTRHKEAHEDSMEHVKDLIRLVSKSLKHATLPIHLISACYLWDRFSG
jgi:hypothetical protein